MARARQLKPWAVPLLSLLAGAAAALGQVPWSFWPLALAGYGLAVWLVASAPGAWAAAWRGWLVGAAHFALALNWITEPFQVDAAQDAWMAPFALVLLAMGLALFWGGASGLGHRLGAARGPAARAFGFALALAAAEALRGVIFTGFPWAVPGHIWLGLPPEQLAVVAGAGGLTLFTLLLAALPVAAGWRGALAGGLLAAAGFGFGAWRLAQPAPPDRDLVLRLVQPNADQALKWDPAHLREFFERQLDLSAAPPDPALPRGPDLILWPETAVAFLLNDPGYGLEVMMQASGGTPIAVGIQRSEGRRGFNSLAVIGRDGAGQPEIRAQYDKHHLVPFGEYIPLGDLVADWLGVFSFSPREGYGYSAGAAPELIALDGLPQFQPLICYEAVFPYFQRATERPDWLLQLTNDSWFGDRSGPYQHAAINRLRAIESGLPLVRVANTGLSFVVDAHGRMRGELALNSLGHLDALLPGAARPTPYVRLGLWAPLLAWLLLAALARLYVATVKD